MLVFAIGLILFCLLIIIPAVNQVLTFPPRNLDLSNTQSLIDKATSLLQTCKRQSFFPLEDWISLCISLALTVFLSVLSVCCKRKSTQNQPSPQSRTETRTELTRRRPSRRDSRRQESIHLRRRHPQTRNPESRSFIPSAQSNESPRTTIDTVSIPINEVPMRNISSPSNRRSSPPNGVHLSETIEPTVGE